LDAPLLREVLAAQGIERLGGKVAIEAEARGERELRDPAQWRVTARISNGTLPIGGGLPAVDKLAGALRYSSGQLRGLTLTGSWLGGPVEVESRKSGSGGGISFALNGVADATLLLRLMGQEAVAQRVAGQFAWSGTAQPGPGSGDWKLSLTSSLGGVESGLPAPFDKPRARGLPVEAQLAISRGGVGEFRVESGRVLDVHGRILDGVTHAQFEVQGVAGEFRHGEAGESEIHVRQLDFSRSPQVLAAAGAVLPAENELNISIDEARFGARNLGALQATITQQEGGVAFSIESADAALHQLSAQGECTSDRRCRSEFSAATRHLAALLADARLPAEWPATSLSAVGSLDWPLDAGAELARSLSGSFEIKAAGDDDDHQLTASATLANGQLTLAGLQGTGPEPDLVFRGEGRLGLTSRDYDFTIDYERVSLAAAAVPSPARTRLARAWHTLRGSAARRGWTEAPETRRVQLHGTWD
jgi:hypothetical protein